MLFLVMAVVAGVVELVWAASLAAKVALAARAQTYWLAAPAMT
jgi:hypothetical protein